MTMLKPELEEQSYGSSLDPVIAGVADGLARLFPPIHDFRASKRDDAPGQRLHVDESEPTGNHQRS